MEKQSKYKPEDNKPIKTKQKKREKNLYRVLQAAIVNQQNKEKVNYY